MSMFKRIFTSVSASVDQLVGEIENHDALIAAAIREQRKKLAAAKVQLRHLQDREQRAAHDIAALQAKCQQWQHRAVKVATDDESRALACLQQRQQLIARIDRLEGYRNQYLQTGRKMTADIARCEDELRNLQQKHELFRARQSSSDASCVLDSLSDIVSTDISASFERWDASIIEKELMAPMEEEMDNLELTFADVENREALESELAELMAAVKAGGSSTEQGGVDNG